MVHDYSAGAAYRGSSAFPACTPRVATFGFALRQLPRATPSRGQRAADRSRHEVRCAGARQLVEWRATKYYTHLISLRRRRLQPTSRPEYIATTTMCRRILRRYAHSVSLYRAGAGRAVFGKVERCYHGGINISFIKSIQRRRGPYRSELCSVSVWASAHMECETLST